MVEASGGWWEHWWSNWCKHLIAITDTRQPRRVTPRALHRRRLTSFTFYIRHHWIHNLNFLLTILPNHNLYNFSIIILFLFLLSMVYFIYVKSYVSSWLLVVESIHKCLILTIKGHQRWFEGDLWTVFVCIMIATHIVTIYLPLVRQSIQSAMPIDWALGGWRNGCCASDKYNTIESDKVPRTIASVLH